MGSNKFRNIWDDTLAVLGSVYGTPKYSSGTENGQAIYTAPATLHFSADQGAPARHVNYALKTLGDDKVKELQHVAMNFREGTDWPTGGIFSVFPARGNRAFVVGAADGVYIAYDEREAASIKPYSATVTRDLVFDDGVRIWSFDNQVNAVHRIDQTSLTHSNDFTNIPLAAGSIGSAGMIITTSGTSLVAELLSGTAFSTTALPPGVYSSSTTSIWGRAQVYLGSQTATGPLLFYSRDSSANNYLYTTNGTSLNEGTWPVSTSATKIADVSYDDVQSLFVLCTVPTAGGAPSFYTSPDGVTWTASTSATGPSGGIQWGSNSDGSNAFSILGGVWLFATQVAKYSNEIWGSALAGDTVSAFYSLDYGQSWYKANVFTVCNSSGKVKIVKNIDRFCIQSDKTIMLSGRLAYPEGV